MKWYGWFIIALVLTAGVYTGGFFHGKSTCPQNPEVIDETSTKTHHVPPPKGLKKSITKDEPTPNIMNRSGLCTWFEKCYKADIYIEGRFNKTKKDWFDVTATDPCKSAKKSFKIGIPSKHEWDQIGIGPSVLIVQDIPGKKTKGLIGATFQYTHWWGNFGLSPSIRGYGALDKEMFAAGADLLINYKW